MGVVVPERQKRHFVVGCMSPSLGDRVFDPTRPGPKERETTHLHFHCRHPRATKSNLFALLVSPSQSDKKRKFSIQYVMGQRTSHCSFGVAIPSNKMRNVSIARCTVADCSRAVGACTSFNPTMHSRRLFQQRLAHASIVFDPTRHGPKELYAELLVCHPRHWNHTRRFSI